jgi:general secretion pathway protein M
VSSRSLPLPPALVAVRQQLTSRWRALARRERRYLSWGMAVVVCVLTWMLAVQPAWRMVRDAPARLDQLDAQLQTMQRLAAESTGLRAAPPVAPSQAAIALKSASDRLGDKARLVLQGDRATLTLTGVSSEALSAWLRDVRSTARARPLEAQLVRNPQGFSGSVVLGFGSAP